MLATYNSFFCGFLYSSILLSPSPSSITFRFAHADKILNRTFSHDELRRILSLDEKSWRYILAKNVFGGLLSSSVDAVGMKAVTKKFKEVMATPREFFEVIEKYKIANFTRLIQILGITMTPTDCYAMLRSDLSKICEVADLVLDMRAKVDTSSRNVHVDIDSLPVKVFDILGIKAGSQMLDTNRCKLVALFHVFFLSIECKCKACLAFDMAPTVFDDLVQNLKEKRDEIALSDTLTSAEDVKDLLETFNIKDYKTLCSYLGIASRDKFRISKDHCRILTRVAWFFYNGGLKDIQAFLEPEKGIKKPNVDLVKEILGYLNIPVMYHHGIVPKILETVQKVVKCFNLPESEVLSDDELHKLFNDKQKRKKNRKNKSRSGVESVNGSTVLPVVADNSDDDGDVYRTVSVKEVKLPSKVLVAVRPTAKKVISEVDETPSLLTTNKDDESILAYLERSHRASLCTVCSKAPKKVSLTVLQMNPEDAIIPCEYHQVCQSCATKAVVNGCSKCEQNVKGSCL